MCPECGGTDVRRCRRRNLLEKVWSWLGIWPYRCFVCTARFFQPYVGNSGRPKFDRRSAPELRRAESVMMHQLISRSPMQQDLTRLQRAIAGSESPVTTKSTGVTK